MLVPEPRDQSSRSSTFPPPVHSREHGLLESRLRSASPSPYPATAMATPRTRSATLASASTRPAPPALILGRANLHMNAPEDLKRGAAARRARVRSPFVLVRPIGDTARASGSERGRAGPGRRAGDVVGDVRGTPSPSRAEGRGRKSIGMMQQPPGGRTESRLPGRPGPAAGRKKTKKDSVNCGEPVIVLDGRSS